MSFNEQSDISTSDDSHQEGLMLKDPPPDDGPLYELSESGILTPVEEAENLVPDKLYYGCGEGEDGKPCWVSRTLTQKQIDDLLHPPEEDDVPEEKPTSPQISVPTIKLPAIERITEPETAFAPPRTAESTTAKGRELLNHIEAELVKRKGKQTAVRDLIRSANEVGQAIRDQEITQPDGARHMEQLGRMLGVRPDIAAYYLTRALSPMPDAQPVDVCEISLVPGVWSIYRKHGGLKESEQAISDINQDYCYSTARSAVLDLHERKIKRVVDFDHDIADHRCKAEDVIIDGVKEHLRRRPASSCWMASNKKSRCYDVVYAPGTTPGFIPSEKDFELPDFNLWCPAPIVPIKGDVSLYLDWLNHAFKKEPQYGSWFNAWIAHQFQHPGVKLFTAVLFQGEPGSGKSIIGLVLSQVHGVNAHPLRPQDLVNRFNSWAARSQFVFADELLSAKSQKEANILKDLVTGTWRAIEFKGQELFVKKDMIAYLLTSNDLDALLISDNERRYAVFQIDEPFGFERGERLVQWAESHDGKAALLYHWLYETDASIVKPHAPAPKTEGCQDMLETSRTPEDLFVSNLVSTYQTLRQMVVMKFSELMEKFQDEHHRFPNSYALRTALKRLAKWRRRVHNDSEWLLGSLDGVPA